MYPVGNHLLFKIYFHIQIYFHYIQLGGPQKKNKKRLLKQ